MASDPRKLETAVPFVTDAKAKKDIEKIEKKALAPGEFIEENHIKDETLAFGVPEEVVQPEPVDVKVAEPVVESTKQVFDDNDYFVTYQYVNPRNPDPLKRDHLISGRPDGFDKDIGQEINEDFLPEFKDYFDFIIPRKYGIRYFANVMNPGPAGIKVHALIPLYWSIRDGETLQITRFHAICFFLSNLSDLASCKTIIKTKLPLILQQMRLDQ